MNPAHDTVNPPGTWTLEKAIQEYKESPQIGYTKMDDGCCHKTVTKRCLDCSFVKILDKD